MPEQPGRMAIGTLTGKQLIDNRIRVPVFLDKAGMKIVGHTDYKTTANIYTHVRDEMLRKATVNLEEVFVGRGK